MHQNEMKQFGANYSGCRLKFIIRKIQRISPIPLVLRASSLQQQRFVDQCALVGLLHFLKGPEGKPNVMVHRLWRVLTFLMESFGLS
jgi:hypothetical protein